MSGLNLHHFRSYVVRPTLEYLDPFIPYSEAAETLLVGTAYTESYLVYLQQLGGGPALGVYQIEPATHTDVWDSWLGYRPDLASRVRSLASQRFGPIGTRDPELRVNLAYATAIARSIYRRHPMPLPGPRDAEGLARMHKVVYNTYLGATVLSESVRFFREAILAA